MFRDYYERPKSLVDAVITVRKHTHRGLAKDVIEKIFDDPEEKLCNDVILFSIMKYLKCEMDTKSSLTLTLQYLLSVT